jgi:hypothetical protein
MNLTIRIDKGDAMKYGLWFLVVCFGLATSAAWAGQAATPTSGPGDLDQFSKAEQAIALVLVGDGNGRLTSVNVGVMIRPDGVLLTSYHALQGALEVQVRLRSGEVYDQVSMMGSDERRDVAALHISAQGLTSLPPSTAADAVPGDKIHVLTASGNPAWSVSEGVLGQTHLADDVPGAGRGYRVTEFTAVLPPHSLGGALLNSRGQFLGILTGSPNSAGNQFAVPLETVAGLSGEGRLTALGSGKNLVLPAVPSHSGPAEHQPTVPDAALANAQSLRVTSSTTFFSPFMLEKELMANSQFRVLGLNLVNGYRGGDLLINVDRPLFTYDFTFSVTSAQSGVLLLTGKVTAIDGPHAAQGIANKLVQALQDARALKAAADQNQAAVAPWL